MRLHALPLALLLALLTAHGASAVGLPVTVNDSDGDGYREANVEAVTPPCAGLYPVVGGGADVHAAGQHVYLVGATSLCQYGVWGDVDPADPDPRAEASVTPIVILWIP